jgi:hypothetical protein
LNRHGYRVLAVGRLGRVPLELGIDVRLKRRPRERWRGFSPGPRSANLCSKLSLPGQGALELLQLPLEAVLAGILPLIGITGDIAFDGAEAVGPVIIATMLLPYLVPPPLVRQIRAEGERARGF